MEWINCLLLLGEAAVYFSIMAALFRARARVGLGVFFCALGVMHFVETYLASVFYIALPFGVISPGSTVLFSGKLMFLLLVYIKEDAATVRQPIYGLLIGNFLMVALALILRQHEAAPVAGRMPDLAFVDEMGVLMIWGTTLLFIDAIAIILLYERLGRSLGGWPIIRLVIASACILTFDQIGFYAALRILFDAPLTVFVGGWLAKLGAAMVFSLLLVFYMRWFERPRLRSSPALGDVFDMLTYRERYEALVEQAGRDALTKLLHRGRFDQIGREQFDLCQASGQPLSLLVIDVDHFKAINDRFGHPAGDAVLCDIAQALRQCAGPDDHVFRIGGEEFAILTAAPRNIARLLGEKIRAGVQQIALRRDFPVTISAGLACASPDMRSIDDLFALADRHLYAAKADGRDRLRDASPEQSSPGHLRPPAGSVSLG